MMLPTSIFASSLPLLLVVSSISSAQYLPSCSYNDCMQAWNGAACAAQSGWDCLCANATAIAQVNTCVATSCTNSTDQEAIYGAIAQICADSGISVTNRPEATFSATSGGGLLATLTAGRGGYGPGGNWGSGAWSSWVSCASTAIVSAPSGWKSGAGGWGPGWGYGYGAPTGTGYYGPWGTKASGVACANGAWTTWTAGWGPYSSWTGLWSGCSTTTATPSPATVTTTVTTDGRTSIITGTTFGVQAQAAVTTSSSGTGSSSSGATSVDVRVMGVCAGMVAALFTVMIAL